MAHATSSLVEDAEQVPVRFEGDGAGSGALTWGQHEIWRQMRHHESWLPIGGVFPLAPEVTLADAVAELRWLLGRYPSLRTQWTLDPAAPSQQVFDSGEVMLEVVNAPDDAEPLQVALDIWQRYWHRDFDFETEWPVRMAVVRHRGVLARRVWMMCHLVTDGTGGRIAVQELAARPAGSPSMPPLEQAGWQQSPAGQRQSRAALRYWEQALGRIPAQRLPRPSVRPQPRYWQGQLDSLAMYRAVRVISDRTRAEAASVLLAVFALAWARAADVNPVAIQVTVNNRFRPGLARTVSPVAQNGLLVLDVTQATVDGLVAATRRAAISAYKHAYYDQVQRDLLIARVTAQRGVPLDLDCYFNDRRIKHRDQTGPLPTPGEIQDALPQATFEWTHKQDVMPYHGLHVNVEDIAATARITMPFDSHRVAPTLVESCLWQMQDIAVSAALDPQAGTGYGRQ